MKRKKNAESRTENHGCLSCLNPQAPSVRQRFCCVYICVKLDHDPDLACKVPGGVCSWTQPPVKAARRGDRRKLEGPEESYWAGLKHGAWYDAKWTGGSRPMRVGRCRVQGWLGIKGSHVI
jgi:hypothetical protein